MEWETNQPNEIKLALVDDHTLLRKGLAYAIPGAARDIKVELEAENGRTFAHHLKGLPSDKLPDVVLLDICMPEMDGFETLRWLRQHYPAIRVIMLTMYTDAHTVLRCIRLGANAYLLKDVPVEELVETIRMVQERGNYYTPFVANLVVAAMQDGIKEEQLKDIVLTSKELEFLRLACLDLPYKDIADKMFISPRTVDIYRDRLFEKLKVGSRVALVLFAIRNKLIRPLEGSESQSSYITDLL